MKSFIVDFNMRDSCVVSEKILEFVIKRCARNTANRRIPIATSFVTLVPSFMGYVWVKMHTLLICKVIVRNLMIIRLTYVDNVELIVEKVRTAWNCDLQ
jgi:hypothetical protein